MALALDTTVGGDNANSYSTLVEAAAFHEANPATPTTAWADLEEQTRIAALIMATRVLDEQCDWIGTKKSATQALRWPRYDAVDQDDYPIANDIIPKALKHATAELAKYLVAQDRFATMDGQVAGLKSVQAGSVSVEFDKVDRIAALPPSVLSLLDDLMVGGSASGFEVPLVRV